MLKASIMAVLVILTGELASTLVCDGVDLELIGMSDEEVFQMFLLEFLVPIGIIIGADAVIALGIYADSVVFCREVCEDD